METSSWGGSLKSLVIIVIIVTIQINVQFKELIYEPEYTFKLRILVWKGSLWDKCILN